jgi:hypothetical protein
MLYLGGIGNAVHRAAVASGGSGGSLTYAMTTTAIASGVHADVHALLHAPGDSSTLFVGARRAHRLRADHLLGHVRVGNPGLRRDDDRPGLPLLSRGPRCAMTFRGRMGMWSDASPPDGHLLASAGARRTNRRAGFLCLT